MHVVPWCYLLSHCFRDAARALLGLFALGFVQLGLWSAWFALEVGSDARGRALARLALPLLRLAPAFTLAEALSVGYMLHLAWEARPPGLWRGGDVGFCAG